MHALGCGAHRPFRRWLLAAAEGQPFGCRATNGDAGRSARAEAVGGAIATAFTCRTITVSAKRIVCAIGADVVRSARNAEADARGAVGGEGRTSEPVGAAA